MALRTDRQQPNVYFGRPGSLVTLPWPRGDLDSTLDRQTFDFLNGAGGHRVSSLIGGSRQFSVNWNALHVDNYALIEKYWLGTMGQGPWVFHDRQRTNMLSLNQSSATNGWYDTRGFVPAATSGVVSSNSAASFIHRTGATRSLRWLFSGTITAPSLSLPGLYSAWSGIPVVEGLPYMFSCWMTPDGVVDSSITVSVRLRWLTATGSTISETNGGDTACTTWQNRTVTATAPSTAAYVLPLIVGTAASITSNSSLYIDELMLEQDSVANPWAPGSGVWPVEILGLSDSTPFAARFRKSPTLVLRELAV
jgi:hypothetical protein